MKTKKKGFSAQTFWEDGYLLNFNSVVTCFAPACYAIWEQDINPKDDDEIKKELPKIYKIFRQKDLFSYLNFIYWFLKGLIQSLAVYYLCQYCINASAIKPDGFLISFWGMSVLCYSSTFAVIILELFIETSNFTILVFFMYFILAVFLYFPIFVYIWDVFSSPIQYYASDFFIYGNFWLIVLVNMAIWGGGKYIYHSYTKIFMPNDIEVLQYLRFFRSTKKQDNKNRKAIKKHSRSSSKVRQEIEMENMAKNSDWQGLIAVEPQGSDNDKRNIDNYNFVSKNFIN